VHEVVGNACADEALGQRLAGDDDAVTVGDGEGAVLRQRPLATLVA
jgi:hypothetical protein